MCSNADPVAFEQNLKTVKARVVRDLHVWTRQSFQCLELKSRILCQDGAIDLNNIEISDAVDTIQGYRCGQAENRLCSALTL